MEYIASRGFKLPINADEMESLYWFNMWKTKQFPYYELVAGDKVYWLETVSQRIVWESKLIKVERFKYLNKEEVFKKFGNQYGKRYHLSRPDRGYCVAYKVRILNKPNLIKPRDERMPQLGWLRVNAEIARTWLRATFKEEQTVLDDTIDTNKLNLSNLLTELNFKMKGVTPNRLKQLVNTTIRNDTLIIKKLKEFYNYTCQFPNCNARIPKKTGGYYIEVAHITPVKKGGKSILGNLIVLCPNHHKEFDYGDLNIHEQSEEVLKGKLNECEFEIKFK